MTAGADDLFDRAFPRRAQLVLEGRHLAQPLGLIAALMVDFDVAEMRFHTLDHFIERHDVGRRVLVAETGILAAATDKAIKDWGGLAILRRAASFI